MIQPNFSAVVVLSVTLMFLYFIGGMPWQFMLPLLLLSGAGAVVAFWPRPGNYRLERLMVMLNPMADPAGSGWQLIQSLYAVASGGLFGVGFGRGVQKYDYLADEPHNDFIFSVIAEELGFFGAAVVILLFVFLAWRGLKIARQASTRFGRLLAYGMTFLIVFQAMVNIGVSIGAVPTTGITLPFISYGGSSIAIMTAAAGILLSISRDRGDRRAS